MQNWLLAAAVVLAGQNVPPFAGTWTAAHDGQTFARLELRDVNGRLEGRISLGAIHVDSKGVIDRVLAPATSFTAIFDVQMRDGMLAFARKDGDDTDRFELRAAGDDVELKAIVTPQFAEELARDGIAPPAPFRLMRSRP